MGLPATTHSIEPCSSITVTFNLDANMYCMFLGKEGEHCTECRKVQYGHVLVELFREEIDVGLASRAFLPIR